MSSSLTLIKGISSSHKSRGFISRNNNSKGIKNSEYSINPGLTLIWMGILGVCFEVCVSVGWLRGCKITLHSHPPSPPYYLKHVRLSWKVEILCISTHTYTVSENIPFSTKAVLILLMSTFFCEKSAFIFAEMAALLKEIV